ncbi:MAG: hypothetical protein MHM6MM_000025 [Cercozoa sp. M6MM]
MSANVRFRTSLRNVVLDVMVRRGWKETEDDPDWDIFWADRLWLYEVFDHVHLRSHQRVNHFRNHYELTRKDRMVHNLKREKRRIEKAGKQEEAKFDFFPKTFTLPAEYSLFVEEFKRKPGLRYIMKPVGRAQGRGIFLFRKLSQIADWKTKKFDRDFPQHSAQSFVSPSQLEEENPQETYVVQRYIDAPYLIGGKKFDLRIFVLVTSYSPLNVYLYRSGFARFSSAIHTNHESSLDDNTVHLTNHAVQKNSDEYNSESGNKLSIRRLRQVLSFRHGEQRVDHMFSQIQAAIVCSVQSVQNVVIQDAHCFELYGYDILIDENLKPWLIEINASPSLSASSAEDYDMKFAVVNDTLELVMRGIKRSERESSARRSRNQQRSAGKNRSSEREKEELPTRVGGFDLVCRNGEPVLAPPEAMFKSLLGCYNPSLVRRYHSRWRRQKHRRANAIAEHQELQKIGESPPVGSRIL